MDWYKIFPDEISALKKMQEARPQRVQIGEVMICLVLFNGKFFAVQDACTHNSESLSKGWVNHIGEIVCPWHNYRFELITGKPCDSSCADLMTYPIRIDESGFYIGI